MPYDEFDRDAALTVTQFMLSPDIPNAEKKHFEKFYLMFSKIMALGNIERRDIFAMTIAFDEICMLLEMGLYSTARQMMGRELMKIQLSRSVEGLQLLYGQQGVQRSEQVQHVMQQRRRKSLGGRIMGAFKKEEKGSWEQVQ